MLIRLLGHAARDWWNDNAMRLGASLAYYTLFAIAPILIVAISVAGTLFGPEAVRGEIVEQIDGLIGPEGARAIQALLQGASERGEGTVAVTIGGVTFVMAACGAFLELQAAFNTIWRVAPSETANLTSLVLDRLRSLGLVVAIGFLLTVSLALSAALAAFGRWLAEWAPTLPALLQALNLLISFAGTTALFGLLFKFLPDVELEWPDVFVGAAMTAALFTIGKHAIGLYLGHSGIGSTYGAVGSVLVLLLWVYYSSQIVLFGAEFTRLYAERTRGPVPPSSFAEKVEPATRT